MRPARLFNRVLLALVALFGCAAALSAGLAARALSAALEGQYHSKGTAIAEMIAQSSVDNLLHDRDAATLQAMVDLYAETEGVGYILVRDQAGEVIAHTFAPAVPAELSRPAALTPGRPRRLDIPGEGKFLDMPAGILDGELGVVHVGMKRETIDAAFWEAVRRQAVALGLVGLAAMGGAWVLTRWIARPLGRLTRYARQIAQADTLNGPTRPAADDLAPIAGRPDEVGQLARALAHMLEALATREQGLKRAEESLRRSEQHFRSLIENVDDVIVLLGGDGAARYVSPSLRRLLGFAPDEWVGRDPAQLIHPDDRAAFRAAVYDCPPASPGAEHPAEGAATEARMLRADGTVRIVDVSLCNLLLDPAVGGVVVTLRDVSDRQRTVELNQAKEAAEEANRLKGQLLNNISHEVRTPMNHIMGMTELALATPLTAEQREYLTIIQSASEQLLGTLTDLLDFSRLEAGRLPVARQPFRVRDLVGDAAALVTPRAAAKGLHLSWEVADAVPDTVVGDADLVRQVLLRLLDNAVKFTPAGAVRVGVHNGQSDNCHSDTLHFEVVDTGIGIEAVKHEVIFEPLRQGDGSSTRQHGGTGMGLAIVARLVGLMGGRLRLESEPGRGSTFHVELPLGRA